MISIREKHNFHIPRAIRITLITRMMVGLIGIIFDSTSSNVIPTMDKMTMPMSSKFHLEKNRHKIFYERFCEKKCRYLSCL